MFVVSKGDFLAPKKNSKHLDMYWFSPVFNCKHRRGVCVSVSLCCDFTSFCVELTTTIQNWDSLTQALVPASNHLWSILKTAISREKKWFCCGCADRPGVAACLTCLVFQTNQLMGRHFQGSFSQGNLSVKIFFVKLISRKKISYWLLAA